MGLCFVVLQLLRMFIGTVGVALIEFLCHSGPLKPHDRKKLASHVWYGWYYTVILAWGAWLFFDVTSWASDMSAVCTWEAIGTSFGTWRSLHIYHCIQVAFYINYLFAMAMGIDVRRKDWKAFAVHHAITLLLILFSRNWGYLRMQLAMLVLHDAADPWLFYAKAIQLARSRWSVMPDLFMVLFALVFLLTRWFLFPVFLVASCRDGWCRSYPSDWTRIHPDIWFAVENDQVVLAGIAISYYGLSMLLLYALQALHAFWGLRILALAHRKFVVGDAGPSGTGDDDSDDEQQHSKKTQ